MKLLYFSGLTLIIFPVFVWYWMKVYDVNDITSSDPFYHASLIVSDRIKSILSFRLDNNETPSGSKILYEQSYLSDKKLSIDMYEMSRDSNDNENNGNSNNGHNDQEDHNQRYLVSHVDSLSLGLDASIFNIVKKKKKLKSNITANTAGNVTTKDLEKNNNVKMINIDIKSDNVTENTTILKRDIDKASVTNDKKSKISVSENFIMGVDENNLPVKIYEINDLLKKIEVSEKKPLINEIKLKPLINELKLNNVSNIKISVPETEKTMVIENLRNFNLSDNNNNSKKIDGKLFYMYDLEEV